MGAHRGRSLPAFLALLALLFAAPPARAQAAAFDHAGLARRMLENHIRPGYDALAAAAGAMAETVAARCEGPGRDDAALERAFDAVVLAWGRAETIDFGPVVERNRLERMLFWPDRQGIGARQIERILAGSDASATDADALAGKSVAIQGLGALERVLMGEAGRNAAGEARAFRCRFGLAIARNLARIAGELVAAWAEGAEYPRLWLAPGPGNRAYFKPAETTAALAKAFDRTLARLIDERLGGPLGLVDKTRYVAPALGASGRSLRLVEGNLEGAARMFGAGGLGASVAGARVPADPAMVAGELATALGVVAELAGTADPFAPGEARRRLIAAIYPLRNAREQAAELIGAAAGLTLGFNASDGD